ncbi:MAG: choice-of-anchor A family protein [Desulfarculaceae bacterium]|nr:choice-of-anchor A family protein [Desulfarculaceae bacterium]MCF8072396.1 choice-of-anchor A family protein [Desulfarculaceae bacterium]MCF8100317.1 choice-of-anchor A family protein [Desulfarculaceae bacterium]MCF8117916.1 choice-of-anchor A family protein [Desulfarculaceae bacterium]
MKATGIRKILVIALAALALLGLAGPALAANVNLGTAGAYSAFVLYDLDVRYNRSSGAYAVGGNANLAGYTIGYGGQPTDTTLVVGGNLKSNIQPVATGQVVVGGKAKLPKWVDRSNIQDKVKDLPVNFQAAQTYLQDLSSTLNLLQSTGTADYRYGGIGLTGDGSSDLQVFDISGDELSNSTWWSTTFSSIPSDAHIILNVSGTDVRLAGGQQALADWSDKIMFNFYEAERLAIQNITIEGSILAPYADVLTSGATINGQIVAKQIEGSFSTTGQKFSPYSGGASTPEPGTLVLLASALGGAAGWGRLRLRRKKR